ncbi:MAG: hypothetical protein A2171_00405 [Candidatus Levybacteria bacterium RBG_13_35_9]|nr:MAG: hypothetical protein A2171_00405 [Candidatus Levybacteria bacterium RBG_13_35_9]
MIDFLLFQKIKLLVIACNTITVTCIEKLRKNYPNLPIVGIVPVIKLAAKTSKSKRIGIFSTLVTSNSKYQKDLIKEFTNDCEVLNLGSNRLVPLIEKLNFEAIDEVLQKELKPFKASKIDTLALGCSHFRLISDQIQKFLPNVLILDSSNAACRQVQRILINNNLLSNSKIPSYNFYTTGDLKPMDYFVNKLTKRGKVERISL